MRAFWSLNLVHQTCPNLPYIYTTKRLCKLNIAFLLTTIFLCCLFNSPLSRQFSCSTNSSPSSVCNNSNKVIMGSGHQKDDPLWGDRKGYIKLSLNALMYLQPRVISGHSSCSPCRVGPHAHLYRHR